MANLVFFVKKKKKKVLLLPGFSRPLFRVQNKNVKSNETQRHYFISNISMPGVLHYFAQL